MLVRFGVALVLVLGLAAVGYVVERDLGTRRDLHAASHVTSRACTRCHADHAESFGRTFHRTMTQVASAETVRATFPATLDYFGVRATMERDEAGRFVVRYGGRDLPERRYVVEMTIGSRRYQQYVARDEDHTLVRLPVAYHLEEQRWFHMNGAFLTPDPEPTPSGSISLADYERHVTRWNDNCVFCHNVSPNPGQHGARFATTVAEHGIACEACHGPGSEHERVNANPLRRYRLHLSGTADPTIVNPARLTPARAADVCGRCHGQRITDDVHAFLTRGDPFVPGEDLALYSAPLWQDTPLAGQPDVFASRFWPDGTPRLTAYEYQGMLESACAVRGELTCISCHGMHEGDPRGQLRPTKQGAAMCTGCHESLQAPSAQLAHAHHDARSLPSCVDCHMPEIVYGVLEAHPTHRIERPDPARAAALERPDACTQCHVDQTRRWAAEARERLWTKGNASLPAASAWSEVETQLFAGDPIERALAAEALGTRSAIYTDTRTSMQARHVAMLLDVMRHDPYPAVRHFAVRTLKKLLGEHESLRGYVPESSPAERKARVDVIAATIELAPLDADMIAQLRATAAQKAIDIGE